MRRAYKFRAYPTRGQRERAEACLDAHRQLYNAALEERREAWRHGVTVHYGDQSAQLTAIRRADPNGQGCWSFTSQQQTLRRLDRAFQGFFDRVRTGRKAGYPRFKSRGPDGTRSTSLTAMVPVGGSRKESGPGQPSRV
jgi:putative transposase